MPHLVAVPRRLERQTRLQTDFTLRAEKRETTLSPHFGTQVQHERNTEEYTAHSVAKCTQLQRRQSSRTLDATVRDNVLPVSSRTHTLRTRMASLTDWNQNFDNKPFRRRGRPTQRWDQRGQFAEQHFDDENHRFLIASGNFLANMNE